LFRAKLRRDAGGTAITIVAITSPATTIMAGIITAIITTAIGIGEADPEIC
jgi:hypothetical protein